MNISIAKFIPLQIRDCVSFSFCSSSFFHGLNLILFFLYDALFLILEKTINKHMQCDSVIVLLCFAQLAVVYIVWWEKMNAEIYSNVVSRWRYCDAFSSEVTEMITVHHEIRSCVPRLLKPQLKNYSIISLPIKCWNPMFCIKNKKIALTCNRTWRTWKRRMENDISELHLSYKISTHGIYIYIYMRASNYCCMSFTHTVSPFTAKKKTCKT